MPENTKETQAGTLVKRPEGWYTDTPNYTREVDGSIATKSTRIATVDAISDGKGNTIPVPKGFYYVGGTRDSGVVISDNQADQNKYKGQAVVPSGITLVKANETDTEGIIKYELVGNQFVWIPVTNIADFTTYEWTSYRYCYSYVDTLEAERMMVEKYGGFYVGRFEAGLASSIDELRTTTKHTGSTQTAYNAMATPQVKPGVIPWMFVDYTNSKASAQSLYKNKASVKSGLLSGAMWDTMITWMTGSSTSTELTTNCTWGNYKNTGLNYEVGRTADSTYSSYRYLDAFSGYTDKNNIKYKTGTLPTYGSSTNAGTLLTTGASSTARKKNIYDVAGNLWEWTEEKAYYRCVATTKWLTSAEHRVCRGGNYLNMSSQDPACYRNYNPASDTSLGVGFRVALYMK